MIVGEPESIVDRPVPDHEGIFYSAEVTGDPRDATPGGPERWRVDVEIYWMSGGRRQSKTFTTMLLREVPFGERMRRLFVAGEEPEPARDRPAQEANP